MTFPQLPRAVVFALIICSAISTRVNAQDPDESPAPPHVSVVSGLVEIERDGRAEPVEPGVILAVGDRVHTMGGRAEVVFGDGSVLHLDEQTALELLDEGLLRLTQGRLLLYVVPAGDANGVEYRIDTPAAAVGITAPGEYRLSVDGLEMPLTELAVARGVAWVRTERGMLALGSGQRVQTRAGQPPGMVMAYNSANWDTFDRWSNERRRVAVDRSATPLPPELRPYGGTLARYGTWGHDITYGSVWYPQVYANWRPYHQGRWVVLAPYGWTWVGADPWAWPTHHYGTWGVSDRGRWFWVPNRTWRAAHVQWSTTGGLVAWAPFGFGNVHRQGWSAVPSRVFHSNVIVTRHAVALSSRRRGDHFAFATQQPPWPTGGTVVRAALSPRHSAVRVAVPRIYAPARLAVTQDAATVVGPAPSSRVSTSRTAIPRRAYGPAVMTPPTAQPAGTYAPVWRGSAVRAPSTAARQVPSAPEPGQTFRTARPRGGEAGIPTPGASERPPESSTRIGSARHAVPRGSAGIAAQSSGRSEGARSESGRSQSGRAARSR